MKKQELIEEIISEYKKVLEALTIKELNEILNDMENHKMSY